ncbi:hypothetical protein Bbelb_205470 [Branchiostoma belcheri]|nr:hypothetical protein Bbelb_205470 [Branchiostoma belcheri]
MAGEGCGVIATARSPSDRAGSSGCSQPARARARFDQYEKWFYKWLSGAPISRRENCLTGVVTRGSRPGPQVRTSGLISPRDQPGKLVLTGSPRDREVARGVDLNQPICSQQEDGKTRGIMSGRSVNTDLPQDIPIRGSTVEPEASPPAIDPGSPHKSAGPTHPPGLGAFP